MEFTASNRLNCPVNSLAARDPIESPLKGGFSAVLFLSDMRKIKCGGAQKTPFAFQGVLLCI